MGKNKSLDLPKNMNCALAKHRIYAGSAPDCLIRLLHEAQLSVRWLRGVILPKELKFSVEHKSFCSARLQQSPPLCVCTAWLATQPFIGYYPHGFTWQSMQCTTSRTDVYLLHRKHTYTTVAVTCLRISQLAQILLSQTMIPHVIDRVKLSQ